MIKKHALVVLSGGQDSVTCLGYALRMFKNVSAITFEYNQRHSCEVEAAKKICRLYDVPQKIVSLGRMLADVADSALTDDRADDESVKGVHPLNENLPASFVPGRNALFLTLAHAYAQTIAAEAIVAGVCQTDYSGYPDCRNEFIRSFNLSLNLGYQTPGLQILTPLMHLTKAQTFGLAWEMGWLPIVIRYSRTCYNGNEEDRHEWGYGCGHCPACVVRQSGWKEFDLAQKSGRYEEIFKK